MAYCCSCGSETTERVPEGDNRPRQVCGSCHYIQYENPRNIVGCLLEWQGKVLLCRRAIEPRKNFWTLPAGFLENGETLADGAARESLEEAHAICQDIQLYGLYSLTRINQVYVMFRATLANGYCAAGEETLEVGLYAESEVPWGELAFPVVEDTLKHYFNDRRRQHYPVRNSDILGSPRSGIRVVQQSS